jgi:uncharacterized protein (TIGR00251 family)
VGSWWSTGDGGISVFVRVVPGARTTAIADVVDDRLRVRIAAPALDGRANRELVRLLAARFGVRRSSVSLVRGERSREKTVWITGLTMPPRGVTD